MLKKLFGGALRSHFRTDGEPKKMNFGALLRAPVAFAVFVVLVSVFTNMMPFYSDGSRMNLMDGLGTVLLMKQGAFTSPYSVPDGGEAYTDKPAPGPESDFYLDDEGGWGIPAKVGRVLRVDNLTAVILLAIIMLMLISLLINSFELPFTFTEKRLYAMAFDPSISNDKFRASFLPVTAPAIFIDLASSVFLGIIFPNIAAISISAKSGEGSLMFFHPAMFVVVIFFMYFWVRHVFSSKRFLSGLLGRRCSSCFHMDTTVIVEQDYVRTDVTTTTTYDVYESGYKKKKKEDTSSHDVYDYTYECTNCGYRFKRRF